MIVATPSADSPAHCGIAPGKTNSVSGGASKHSLTIVRSSGNNGTRSFMPLRLGAVNGNPAQFQLKSDHRRFTISLASNRPP